ncbi:unnamed protein product [Acanthoscelides obtectus]|uniref:Uncharacterized protein n=1 Tax=Acanthoscelides obtectus TaxID=200917 RepID=A0A9P0LQD0_ACAOB|nr:unnamed protein product [Acanthoscelides obtectus]CAK1672301.1 hypothetical protein AOBTE_LOCUS28767 [Acanthoscelides obtectus]
MGFSDNDDEKIKGIFTDRFLQTIAERVAQLLARKHETRLREQEQTIVELKQEIRDLRDTQDRILRTADDQEQASRNLNVNVFGLTMENPENLHKKVQDIFKRMKVNIDESCIVKCHRAQPKANNNKPPAVLIRFSCEEDRSSIPKNLKYLRSTGVLIKEGLTKKRLDLLVAAVNKYTYKNAAWCRNGPVFVKLGDVMHRINNSGDLQKLVS